MKKICNMCKVEKDITEFRKSGKYYRSECKECYYTNLQLLKAEDNLRKSFKEVD